MFSTLARGAHYKHVAGALAARAATTRAGRAPFEHGEMAADGLTTIASAFGPRPTMDRLEAAVRARGMSVFARVDHAAGATALGLPLRSTELLIFGNAKGGTPLMQASQAAGIDLPLKALVWEDARGTTWLSYNDPAWVARRHALGPDLDAPVAALAAALGAIAREAAGPS
jgi:uncharacterized protein (DUF302 family)